MLSRFSFYTPFSRISFRHFMPFQSNSSTSTGSSNTRANPNTASHQDYYTILGVNRDSKAEEFKANYYKLAKQFHPDSTINYDLTAQQWAAKRFQLIGIAYGVLSDPVKRQHYDTFLDLTAIGDQDRMIHWIKINRPPEQLSPPPSFGINVNRKT